MVRLRLQRLGSKNRPFYRVVAADIRSPRDGRFIEILGTYNPVSLSGGTSLNADRIQYWLGKGARPTEKVASLIKKQGIEVAGK
ncbi:MAG: 30S ribosomal protein S16 [Leptospiraceae bacterium]|nr:30S ribosomal protein S16 [Leptospiraceae bacterium]MCB1315809.1 30S ribosomal protein S16 [Leptospiraceae bacterium]